jgi:hypothetical protein
MYSKAQQYDDWTWQALQGVAEGSQSGTERVPGWWNAFDPQIFAECASTDTFAASQPLQPTDHEAPSHPPNDLQPHTFTTSWVDDQSLQLSEPWQPLATPLPGPPLQDHHFTQSFMIDNRTTRQHGQILGEVPESQHEISQEMTGDQSNLINQYHTNQHTHPYTELSTIEYGHQNTNFSTPLPSNIVFELAPIMSNSAELYDPLPEFGSTAQSWPPSSDTLSSYGPVIEFGWTPQLWPTAGDPSSSSDLEQQPDPFSFNPDTFGGGLEYGPSQLEPNFDVATSLGSSSRNAQEIWLGTSNQPYQTGPIGLPPYQGVGKQIFRLDSTIPYCIDSLYIQHHPTTRAT